MKTLIAAVAVVALGAGGGTAYAGGSKCQTPSPQSGQMQQHQQKEQLGMAPSMEQQPSASQAANSFQGTVASVNLEKGQLKACDAQGKSMTFSASPDQISNFNRGDSVAFNYESFGSSQWISEEGVGGTGQEKEKAGGADLGPSKSLSGTIMNLDKNQGSFMLKGLSFKAHPQYLQSLSSGQLVSVTFQTYGTQNWASSVTSGTGGSGIGEEPGMGGSGSSLDLEESIENETGTGDQGVGGSGSEPQDSPAN